jgi:hypothetical protein
VCHICKLVMIRAPTGTPPHLAHLRYSSRSGTTKFISRGSGGSCSLDSRRLQSRLRWTEVGGRRAFTVSSMPARLSRTILPTSLMIQRRLAKSRLRNG